MPQLSEEIRQDIIDLFVGGFSQRNIATKLGISKSGVQYTIGRYKFKHTIKNIPQQGWPRKYSDHSARSLCRLSKLNSKLTARALKNQSFGFESVSISTVKGILRKYGLFGRVSAKKPRLNMSQIKKRLSWCKDYSKVDSAFWTNVIFSSRRNYVRRPKNTRFLSKYVTSTTKFGGKSIMVWGCIKENGERYLIRANCNINSVEYQRILKEGLIPNLNKNSILQQDNAPCHKARYTQNFMDNNHVCCIDDWPSQSPDLNIIENLWKYLKDRLSTYSPRNTDEFWAFAKENGLKFQILWSKTFILRSQEESKKL